jgi:cap2 methyltransferase
MVKTHVQYFTDDDAKYWSEQSDKYIVFCSDIRTEPADEENVKANMDMQLRWWKIMNPQLSMFKFRLQWNNDETEYPEGDIYSQPYCGPTSTETRLIVKKDAKIISYSNKKYEEQLFYHNNIRRKAKYNSVLGDVTLEKDGVDNCYDCTSFINIISNYLAFMNSNKKDKC